MEKTTSQSIFQTVLTLPVLKVIELFLICVFVSHMCAHSGGESGSADTARDPRGFAVKFYTEEGNWDLVGNNTPIFFIRDPIFVSYTL